MTEPLTTNAADRPRYRYTLLQPTLERWCCRCRAERVFELPRHPAGMGRCQTCDSKLDLADFPGAEVSEYLRCYARQPHDDR